MTSSQVALKAKDLSHEPVFEVSGHPAAGDSGNSWWICPCSMTAPHVLQSQACKMLGSWRWHVQAETSWDPRVLQDMGCPFWDLRVVQEKTSFVFPVSGFKMCWRKDWGFTLFFQWNPCLGSNTPKLEYFLSPALSLQRVSSGEKDKKDHRVRIHHLTWKAVALEIFLGLLTQPSLYLEAQSLLATEFPFLESEFYAFPNLWTKICGRSVLLFTHSRTYTHCTFSTVWGMERQQ